MDMRQRRITLLTLHAYDSAKTQHPAANTTSNYREVCEWTKLCPSVFMCVCAPRLHVTVTVCIRENIRACMWVKTQSCAHVQSRNRVKVVNRSRRSLCQKQRRVSRSAGKVQMLSNKTELVQVPCATLIGVGFKPSRPRHMYIQSSS